ncbi:ubiquitin-protein ligase [Ordospora colligata]|nr:ubiquitin-protein ligase [Ordospora colligata]
MDNEASNWKYANTPVEEELDELAWQIAKENDTSCILEKIRLCLSDDVWIFKDSSLKLWKNASDRILLIVHEIGERYFCEGMQISKMCDADKMMIVEIFRFYQRMYGYSKHKYPLDVSEYVMKYIYAVDADVVIEAYKVLSFSLQFCIGLEEYAQDHEMLLKCIEIALDEDEMGELNVSEGFYERIPDEMLDIEMFTDNGCDCNELDGVAGNVRCNVCVRSAQQTKEALIVGAERYGRGKYIFELRKKIYSDRTERLDVIRILARCVFLVLAKGGEMFDCVTRKIDALEMNEMMNGRMSEDMEFAVMSLIDVLIYYGVDFLKVSVALGLDDVKGPFYCRYSAGLNEKAFERHMVFFVSNALVLNQKARYLKMDVLMECVEVFRQCRADVRYHILRSLKMYCKEPRSRGLSEFILRGGIAMLEGYLKDSWQYGINENVNVRYAVKVLGEIYMQDWRGEIGVRGFEESEFLDILVSMIRRLYSVDIRTVCVCMRVLSCFAFGDPLSIGRLVERGVMIVFEKMLMAELTIECFSEMVSCMDAFSLNLDAQRMICDSEYLFKLLFMLREDEFLKTVSGSSKVMSLLNVLIMHHPVFRDDLVKFYVTYMQCLTSVFEMQSKDAFVVDEWKVNVMNNFFGFIGKMQVYPDAEEACILFRKVYDFFVDVNYACRMHNPMKGIVVGMLRNIYSMIDGDVGMIQMFIRDSKMMADLLCKRMHDGVINGYSWTDEEEEDDVVDKLMFSYSNHAALMCILIDDVLQNKDYILATDLEMVPESVGMKMLLEMFDGVEEMYMRLSELSGVFLDVPDADMFVLLCKAVSVDLDVDISKCSVRLCLIRSIYSCVTYLVRSVWKVLVEVAPVHGVKFLQKAVNTCLQDNGMSVVMMTRLFKKLCPYFRPEHCEVVSGCEFAKQLLGIRGEHSKVIAIVNFIISELLYTMREDNELRHRFLQYLLDIDMIDGSLSSIDDNQRNFTLSNLIIDAVQSIFDEEDGDKIQMLEYDMNMVMCIYEKFYIPPECKKIKIERLVRSPICLKGLMRIKAYSSIRCFVMRYRKVYEYVCASIANFEYSDEFVEMAGDVFLSASVGMCPHLIDVKMIEESIPVLIESDVSVSKTLYFLRMYFRLLTVLRMPMPYNFDLEKLMMRIRTCSEMMEMRMLLGYAIRPGIQDVLGNVAFPKQMSGLTDADEFLKPLCFLMYRDYGMFVRKCVEAIAKRNKMNCTEYDYCKTDSVCSNADEEVCSNANDEVHDYEEVYVRKLIILLDSQKCMNKAIQFLSEIMMNHASLLGKICTPSVLNKVYEKCIRDGELSPRHGHDKEIERGVCLFAAGLLAESRVVSEEMILEFNEGMAKVDAYKMPVCTFLISKVRDEDEEAFMRAVYIIGRCLVPQVVLKHEREDDRSKEDLRRCSLFLSASGIFSEIIKRLACMEESSSIYELCVHYGMDCLNRMYSHCHGSVVNAIEDYENESNDEYFSIGSDEQEFSESGISEEGYFEDMPFHGIEVEDEAIDDSMSSEESRSDDVVVIKSIETEYEMPTAMYTMCMEYNGLCSEVKDDVQGIMCRKLYEDLVQKEMKEMKCCENKATDALHVSACVLNCVKDGDYVQRVDRSGSGNVNMDMNESVNNVNDEESINNVNDEESLKKNIVENMEDVVEVMTWDEWCNELYACNSVSEMHDEIDINDFECTSTQYEYEEGSSESDLGVVGGEIPMLEASTLNAMEMSDLIEYLDSYFIDRRAKSMDYAGLAVEFYEQLSNEVRVIFEEKERVYRESFFRHETEIESNKDVSDSVMSVEECVEVDENVFCMFVSKVITEKEIIFLKSRKLIERMCTSTKMRDAAFKAVNDAILSIYVDNMNEATECKFRRCLLLLVSMIKRPWKDRCIVKNTVLVCKVFEVMSKIKMTEEILKLVAEFSFIFKEDKNKILGIDMNLDGVICMFVKEMKCGWFTHVEVLVENTSIHFGSRYMDVIFEEIRKKMNEFKRIIDDGRWIGRYTNAQRGFVRLWKLATNVFAKVYEVESIQDEVFMELVTDPFWTMFFERQDGKVCVEDLMNVSDIFESFFAVGKAFESRKGLEEDMSFKEFYTNVLEKQSKQINLLVEERPERFFKSFNRLINRSILTFSNKKKYLCRKLRVEGTDKLSVFYKVYVDRDDVLRSSYFQVMAKSPEDFRTKRFEIKLAGEEGLDYGGITREWLLLLAKDLLDPNFALFEFSTEDKTVAVPCKNSHVNPEHLSYFKFVGRIMAKAIMEGYFLNLQLPKFVYKHILGKTCGLDDLKSVDNEFYKSLIWIRDHSVDESLGLMFSFTEVSFGVNITTDLIDNGRDVFVSESNKKEYVRVAAWHRLFNGIEAQLSALKAGIFEILGEDALDMFDENELELLVCGIPEINVDDWKSNTLYYGYTESSKTIIWFWKAVKCLDSVQKAKLLQFATGTSTLPFEGFSHLQGNNTIQKFSIHKMPDRMDSLPTAHTCFNQLVLPSYSSYETMLKCLTTAINECSTGFGFI